MSYSIRVRVIQSKPADWYTIVEKTVWHAANGSTWTEVDGEQRLTMGGRGTSGMLRFKNPHGDYFLVALGIHKYKRWCDIVTDTKLFNTNRQIHPSYYGGDGEGAERDEMVWKELPNLEKTTGKGVRIKVDYYKEDENTFYVTITITLINNAYHVNITGQQCYNIFNYLLNCVIYGCARTNW